MKIKIMSDLHRCINKNYPIELEDNCDYTLIAGDLGPDYKDNVKWLKDNLKRGAFISGNHDAYTHDNTPIDDVKEFYHKNFPVEGDISYFDSDVGVISKEIGENILLIADVMYTDYKLRTDSRYYKGKKLSEVIKHNMFLAEPKFSGSYMNDFNFYTRKGTYKKTDRNSVYGCPDDLYYIRAKNYKEHFDRTFKEIDKLVKDNPNKDIIIMTHHCLSKKCISDEYSKDTLNASYVSSKDSWIKKHPNIKLIVSGHVHHRNSFKVGNTLYVLNPRGYCKRGEDSDFDVNTKKRTYWTQNCFVNTEDWSLSYERGENDENEELMEQHKKDDIKFLSYMSIFC